MKKFTETELKRMTRRELWNVGFTCCSERDLCKERGGFQAKEIMIANILKRQDAYTVWIDENDFVANAVAHHVRARNSMRRNSR